MRKIRYLIAGFLVVSILIGLYIVNPSQTPSFSTSDENPNATTVILPNTTIRNPIFALEDIIFGNNKTSSSTANTIIESVFSGTGTTSSTTNSELRVDFIDVGQADFIVISCDGIYATIDGGNVADSQLVYSYLDNRGITYIDTAVVTHAHEDHCGAVSAILSHSTVGKIYSPVTSYDTKAFNNVVKKAEEQGLSLTVPNAGDTFSIGSATAKIIGPVKNYEEPNNTSIVIKLTHGNNSFLFTGDMESEAEADILDAGFNVKANVLKAAHHGSSTSSSYRFLREVLPKYTVITSNREDAPSYDHPHDVVLSRLKDAETDVYRTDLQGTITCISDGSTLTFSVEKNPNADTFYELND